MADFKYPQSKDADALDAKFITSAKAKKAGKLPANDGFPKPSPSPQPQLPKPLTSREKVSMVKAQAKATEVRTKEAIAKSRQHELYTLAKKIDNYKKRFPERLAPLKLKAKYTKVEDARADYQRIRDLFCEVDPEPILTGLYVQGASYASTHLFPHVGIAAPQYGPMIKEALTPGTRGFNPALKDIMGEISVEYASYFAQGLWKRFIGINAAMIYQLHTSNILKSTPASSGLADRINAFSKSVGSSKPEPNK